MIALLVATMLPGVNQVVCESVDNVAQTVTLRYEGDNPYYAEVYASEWGAWGAVVSLSEGTQIVSFDTLGITGNGTYSYEYNAYDYSYNVEPGTVTIVVGGQLPWQPMLSVSFDELSGLVTLDLSEACDRGTFTINGNDYAVSGTGASWSYSALGLSLANTYQWGATVYETQDVESRLYSATGSLSVVSTYGLGDVSYSVSVDNSAQTFTVTVDVPNGVIVESAEIELLGVTQPLGSSGSRFDMATFGLQANTSYEASATAYSSTESITTAVPLVVGDLGTDPPVDPGNSGTDPPASSATWAGTVTGHLDPSGLVVVGISPIVDSDGANIFWTITGGPGAFPSGEVAATSDLISWDSGGAYVAGNTETITYTVRLDNGTTYTGSVVVGVPGSGLGPGAVYRYEDVLGSTTMLASAEVTNVVLDVVSPHCDLFMISFYADASVYEGEWGINHTEQTYSGRYRFVFGVSWDGALYMGAVTVNPDLGFNDHPWMETVVSLATYQPSFRCLMLAGVRAVGASGLTYSGENAELVQPFLARCAELAADSEAYKTNLGYPLEWLDNQVGSRYYWLEVAKEVPRCGVGEYAADAPYDAEGRTGTDYADPDEVSVLATDSEGGVNRELTEYAWAELPLSSITVPGEAVDFDDLGFTGGGIMSMDKMSLGLMDDADNPLGSVVGDIKGWLRSLFSFVVSLLAVAYVWHDLTRGGK